MGHLDYFDETKAEKEENRREEKARRQEDRKEWEHEEEILRAALPNLPMREKDILWNHITNHHTVFDQCLTRRCKPGQNGCVTT
jgi:hypothetical protein